MRVKEIAELLSINVGRVEAIASALKINHSADLSDENVEAIAKVAEEMARQNTASIDQAVRSVMGAPAQSEPHRPEPPRKKSDGGGLVEARNAANEARALQAARYKEAAKETTRQTVQNAQKMGAQQADVASAAYLTGFVARSADNLQQSAMFFDMVYNASEEAIGEGASEVFTLEGAETMAALPPNNWTF